MGGGPPASKLFFQRFAGDEFHHEKGEIAAFLVDLVDGDDVFVSDRSRRPGFPAKSLPRKLVLGQLGIEHLDSHVAFEACVHTVEDHAHAAATDHPDDIEVAHRAEIFAVGGGI